MNKSPVNHCYAFHPSELALYNMKFVSKFTLIYNDCDNKRCETEWEEGETKYMSMCDEKYYQVKRTPTKFEVHEFSK